MNSVLITGITGYLGRALAEKYLAMGWRVIGVSRNEYIQWRLQLGWQEQGIDFKNCTFCLADVANYTSIKEVFTKKVGFGGSLIIHTAALKHVDYAEKNRWEYLRVNEFGTYNICRLADQGNTKVIFTSSDKACYPEGAYGCTKKQAEGIVLDYNGVVVRMGNLIQAHGNILEKIMRSNPTCTCRGMTRFFEHTDVMADRIMGIAGIVGTHDSGIYAIKSKVATTGDIFDALTSEYGETREFRPGERMHEYLVTKNDRPVHEYENYFYVGDAGGLRMPLGFEYSSSDCKDRWTVEEIKTWLKAKQ